MNKTNASLILKMLIVGLWLTSEALAQDQGNAAAQANNPLANMVAFNIQNYYIGELTESDENANQLWLRYAQPFSIAKKPIG